MLLGCHAVESRLGLLIAAHELAPIPFQPSNFCRSLYLSLVCLLLKVDAIETELMKLRLLHSALPRQLHLAHAKCGEPATHHAHLVALRTEDF